ncbi:MAG: hypothetical protein ACYDA6_07995 [Solirubrobacteraceae bacterium]
MAREIGGDAAVGEVLRESGCTRTIAEPEKGEQWLSFRDAIALLDAGECVTCDPFFARHVGERAIPMVKHSPVPQMLRDLGSVEQVYCHIAATSGKMNRVAYSDAREVCPGYAELVITAREGFPRARQHCERTRGLLTNYRLPLDFHPPSSSTKKLAMCFFLLTVALVMMPFPGAVAAGEWSPAGGLPPPEGCLRTRGCRRRCS